MAHLAAQLHSVQELVSQRVYGLILGYEDLNDHDHLRRDPVHGLICGKRDPLGQDRLLEREVGYMSPSYLAQVFRRTAGMAPTELWNALAE